jgi:type I restriction enzyme, S subunit
MSEAILAPKLRFPEFSGDWVQRKAGAFFDQVSGFPFKSENISESSEGVRVLRGINITEGFIRHSQEMDRYYLGDISKFQKYIIHQGDLVLGMDGSKVGKNVAVVSLDDAGSLLIQRVARLRDNGVGCLGFVYHHIFSYRFHRYVDVVNTSSGIPHISAKHINDFPIISPAKPEQQKIAAFLTSVDTKIEQLSAKQELISEFKKGVIQKIFSQEIRFKADDGSDYPDWEEKIMGDIINFLSDYTANGSFASLKENVTYYSNLNYAVLVRTTDLEKKHFDPQRFTDQKGYEFLKKTSLFGGEIVMANVGSIGKVYRVPIYNYPMTLAPNTYVLKFELDISENFIFQLMLRNNFKNKLLSMVGSSTLKAINKANLRSIKVEIPSLPEQTKIANFLSSIDSKIEQIGKQLDESKHFKKALLQQMFV